MITLADLSTTPLLVATPFYMPFLSETTGRVRTGRVFNDYGVLMIRPIHDDGPYETRLLQPITYTTRDLSGAPLAWCHGKLGGFEATVTFHCAWERKMPSDSYFPQISAIQDGLHTIPENIEWYWFHDVFPAAHVDPFTVTTDDLIKTASLVTGPPKGRRRYR